MRYLLSLLLLSCAEPPSDAWSCMLIYVCDADDRTTSIPFWGSEEETQELADEWSEACLPIAAGELEEGACRQVLCGAVCFPR